MACAPVRVGIENVILPAAVMSEGSVTFSIWTLASMFPVTATYVSVPDSNVVMPCPH